MTATVRFTTASPTGAATSISSIRFQVRGPRGRKREHESPTEVNNRSAIAVVELRCMILPFERLRTENGDRFNLYLRPVVQQTLHLDQRHRGKVFTEMRAIRMPNFLASINVFPLIGNVYGKSRDLVRLATGCNDDRNNILECAIKLRDEIVADDRLLVVPTNLPGDE